MSYHKIDDNEDHYVLHHQDGHEVKIAKKALSGATLKRIQHLAQGGEVKKEAPVTKETADSFNKGFFKPTGYEPPKPQQQRVAKYADGGEVGDAKKFEELLALNEAQPQAPAYSPAVATTPPEVQPQLGAAEKTGQFVGNLGRESLSNVGGALKMLAAPVGNAASGFVRGLSGSPASQPNSNVKRVNDVGSVPAVDQAAPKENFPLGESQPQTNPLSDLGKTSEKLLQGVEQQKAGIGQEAEAQALLGQQQSDIYAKQAEQAEQLTANYQNSLNTLKTKGDELQKSIAEYKEDPNRFYNNMSVGQHVGASIGMLLGGFSRGINGVNPAQEHLDKLIDRDIQAQRNELGKKENQLAANMKEYGNLKDSMDVLKMQQLTTIKAQLDRVASASNNPVQKARAQQESAIIDQKIAPIADQFAKRDAALKMINGGGGLSNPQAAATAVRFLVPEGQQGEAFKELDALDALQKGATNAVNAYDKVNAMVGGGVFSPNQRDALINPVIAQLSKQTAGKFTETDAHFISSLFPQKGDSGETRKVKREQLIHLLSEKMNSNLLRSYGIPAPKLHNTAPISVGGGYTQASYRKP